MALNLKITQDVYKVGNLAWLKHQKGFDTCRSITVDITLFNADHKAQGFIPSGTAVGLITATGKYGPYNNGAAAGVGDVCAGLLLHDVRVTDDSGNALGDAGAAMLWEGIVDTTKLPDFAPTTTGEVDAAAKTDLPTIRWENG